MTNLTSFIKSCIGKQDERARLHASASLTNRAVLGQRIPEPENANIKVSNKQLHIIESMGCVRFKLINSIVITRYTRTESTVSEYSYLFMHIVYSVTDRAHHK